MFSGIVAATGRIQNVSPLEDGVRLTVDVGSLDLSDVQLGDSIANNGVCLTVIARYMERMLAWRDENPGTEGNPA